jgi:succinoglycan biosynthesis protein ExoM
LEENPRPFVVRTGTEHTHKGNKNPRQYSRHQRVAICVCTYRRPQMLQRCLDSLARQVVDKGIEIEIVVVDNEPEPNNRDAVIGFVNEWTAPRFHYVLQPKRGIAAARNATLDEALELNADWIAFIDDDATAASDWIAPLMAPEYRDTPILLGGIIYDCPDAAPFWVTGKRQAGKRGAGRGSASRPAPPGTCGSLPSWSAWGCASMRASD